MKKSIFIKMFLISFISILVCVVFIAVTFESSYRVEQAQNYRHLLESVLRTDHNNDSGYLSEIAGGYKVAVLDAQGNIISKTGAVQTDLNSAREVVEAMESGYGVEERSENEQNCLYVAVKQGDFIYRMTVPTNSDLDYFTLVFAPFGFSVLIALIIAFLFSGRVARVTMKPMEEISKALDSVKYGDYNLKFNNYKYEEINSILVGISYMLDKLTASIKDTQNEKNKLEFIVNNFGQGLALVDENSKILHYNSSIREIFKSYGKLNGKQLLYLTHSNELNNSVKECIQNNTTKVFDMNHENIGKVYSCLIKPVHTSWLNKGCILIITNVTQDRKSQNIRKEFVANVSHELKTPITSISGFSQMLSSGMVQNEEQQKEYIDRIYQGSLRMQELIDDILELSCLDEATVPDVITPADVSKTIAWALELEQGNIESKQIKTTVTCREGLFVAMDKKHFETVMGELITNAVKYNKQDGEIKIMCAVENKECIISVQDSGIGIDSTHLPRLFERFYRVDKSRNGKTKGTGLGLSIIKHIVSVYSGDIKVISEKNTGTTFVLKVKVAQQ